MVSVSATPAVHLDDWVKFYCKVISWRGSNSCGHFEGDDVQFQIGPLCCVVLTGSVLCLPLSWLDRELARDSVMSGVQGV
jgi:hypothetical protein